MSQTTQAKSTLARIAETVGDLPASPSVISAVMGLTSNLDSGIDDVARVLAADQSLTAKVLKLSNSSFYGRSKGVSSLDEAIAILGFFNVRSMVVATSAHNLYNAEGPGGPEAQLWEHSLATAVVSRQIADHIAFPQKDEVYIAALLHDIGKLVLMQRLFDRYYEVIEEVEVDRSSFIDVERRQLGFDHSKVGLVLLEKWSFPALLADAVAAHHDPDDGSDGESPRMSRLIYLGNQAAKTLGVGFADARAENLSEIESARTLGLDDEAWKTILARASEHYMTEVRILKEG